jgi:hypothetical protein
VFGEITPQAPFDHVAFHRCGHPISAFNMQHEISVGFPKVAVPFNVFATTDWLTTGEAFCFPLTSIFNHLLLSFSCWKDFEKTAQVPVVEVLLYGRPS